MGESDDSDCSEEEVKLKVLPNRSTRGVRVRDLHQEGDDEFWGQDFFKDGVDDQDYESEEYSEDVVDSDFDCTEDDEDEEEVVVQKEKTKKKNVYVDRQSKATKAKQKLTPAAAAKSTSKAAKRELPDAAEVQADRKLRKSTKKNTTETAVARAKSDKARAAAIRKRPTKEKKILTQEDLLAEALETEVFNKQSLDDLLHIEETNKKNNAKSQYQITGPSIISKCKGGKVVITFARHEKYPTVLQEHKTPPPTKRPLCAITGEPAKYFDPSTKLPYSSLAAFQELRRRHQESIDTKAAAAKDQNKQRAEQRAKARAEKLGEQRQAAIQEQEEERQATTAAAAIAATAAAANSVPQNGYNMNIMPTMNMGGFQNINVPMMEQNFQQDMLMQDQQQQYGQMDVAGGINQIDFNSLSQAGITVNPEGTYDPNLINNVQYNGLTGGLGNLDQTLNAVIAANAAVYNTALPVDYHQNVAPVYIGQYAQGVDNFGNIQQQAPANNNILHNNILPQNTFQPEVQYPQQMQ